MLVLSRQTADVHSVALMRLVRSRRIDVTPALGISRNHIKLWTREELYVISIWLVYYQSTELGVDRDSDYYYILS